MRECWTTDDSVSLPVVQRALKWLYDRGSHGDAEVMEFGLMAKIVTYAKPTWLYRYRSLRQRGNEGAACADPARLEREIEALVAGYIHCSTFDRMNDPMEGFFRANPGGTSDGDADEFFAAVRSEKMSLGIASLSETWDNELMWAH